jgi:Mrp family chromosome partitioning ATPase
LAYAELGPGPVLLLEADVSHPTLAGILGMPVADCFALQLYDKYDGSLEPWRGASAHLANLHVLAASPVVAAGEPLPLRELSRALSELLRLPYARVVVACPEVLGTANVNVIEGFVDGVLLVGRAGSTRGEHLQRAAAQLLPARVLGTALLPGD